LVLVAAVLVSVAAAKEVDVVTPNAEAVVAQSVVVRLIHS
jgi:hypothetical protein